MLHVEQGKKFDIVETLGLNESYSKYNIGNELYMKIKRDNINSFLLNETKMLSLLQNTAIKK